MPWASAATRGLVSVRLPSLGARVREWSRVARGWVRVVSVTVVMSWRRRVSSLGRRPRTWRVNCSCRARPGMVPTMSRRDCRRSSAVYVSVAGS